MTIRLTLAMLLLIVLLSACTLSPTPELLVATATSTQMPQPTATPTQTAAPTNTPTPTATPTITPPPTATPTVTPTPIHPVGSIVVYEPDEEIIYKWFSYVSENLSKEKTIYILVTGLHGSISSYEEMALITESLLRDSLKWPKIDQFVLLAPVIPRRIEPDIYPIAYDVNSFYESDEFHSRADLKVNLMIDKLIGDLTADGYKISTRAMIEGYSAGGMFAQRYALLHPNRVKALAAGQCGGTFILPISEFDGKLLNWPVGINNLGDLASISFEQDGYSAIAQYIYIGDLDSGEGGTTTVYNRLHPTWGVNSLWESKEQMEFLHDTFGETDPVRLQSQVGYLNSIGYDNIEFKMYPGVSHEITYQMISDFMEFLVNHATE